MKPPRKATEVVDGATAAEKAEVLVVVTAPAPVRGARFTLVEGTKVVIGADATCDFVLEATGVSHQHATLSCAGGVWWCADEKSKNGTFVNERLLAEPFPLVAGDRVRLGHVVIQCMSLAQLAAIDKGQDGLPFPIAVLQSLVDAQRTGTGRTAAILSGLELALRFVVAVEIGWLRGRIENEALANVLKGTVDVSKPLTMGAFRSLAFQLARLFPADAEPDPVVRMARGFDAKLGRQLDALVAYRNSKMHAMGTDAVRSDDTSEMSETFSGFIEAVAPLEEAEMVTVAERDTNDDDDSFRYKLYAHNGPSEIFPVKPWNSEAKLRLQWSHLLLPRPICLSPLFAGVVPPGGTRVELVSASQLVFGPKGAPVRLTGIATQSKVDCEAPADRDSLALYDLTRR